MTELIRCLGGSVELMRRLRVKHGFNPGSGHRLDSSIPDEEFKLEHLADYVYDFAAAHLSAADDHILALETLLLEEQRKIPPFVLGRAAIEAAGRAALFMDEDMPTLDKVGLVLAERRHEYQALREMIGTSGVAEASVEEEDAAYVDLLIALLDRFAQQHGLSIRKRPSFTRVFRYALDLGEGRENFGAHATTLLSALAHAVPDVLVGVSNSSGSTWRPGHIGFLDVDKVVLINLIRGVMFAYFRAAECQIAAYGWDKEPWRRWREGMSELTNKAAEYVEFTLADRHPRRSSEPSQTLLGPDPIEPGPVTEKTLERWGTEAMEEANIDPSKIYAWQKTGRIVADVNMHLLSAADIKEWSDAVEEYRTKHADEFAAWLSEFGEEDEELALEDASESEQSGSEDEEDWIAIRVELVSGVGHKFDPPPGRLFLVGRDHTFLDLHEAIESSFGRWEQVHLHVFEMSGGERIGVPNPELPDADGSRIEVMSKVKPGDRFTYVFDFGDDWRHECQVEEVLPEDLPEPGEERFIERPFPMTGWGWLPDQYGRRTKDAQEPGFD